MSKSNISNIDNWDDFTVSTPVLRDTGGRVDLRQNAWDQGEEEMPKTEATQPNSDEDLIIGYFKSEHSALRKALKERFKALHQRFQQACKTPSISGLKGEVSDAKTSVMTDIAKNKTALTEAWCNRVQAEKSRVDFKKAHGLTREARYPESKLLHFAIILMIVLLECVANMYFFAQGNELGLLGGIFQAALISVVNVGSAIMIGFFVARAASHISLAIKLPAITGLICYVAGIIAFNLLAGHYRDLMSVDGAVLEAAIPSLIADPLGLSFHSVLLFVSGLIAASLGVYKGMTVDDTYLGFGDVDRDYRSAVRDYTSVHGEVLAQVVARMDNLCDASKALRQDIDDKRETMENCIDELSTLTGTYQDRVASIADECRRHLKSYRQDNEYMRLSEAPAYFHTNFGDFSDEGSNSITLPQVSEWKDRMKAVEPDMQKAYDYSTGVHEGRAKLIEEAIADLDKALAGIKLPPIFLQSASGDDKYHKAEKNGFLEMNEEA